MFSLEYIKNRLVLSQYSVLAEGQECVGLPSLKNRGHLKKKCLNDLKLEVLVCLRFSSCPITDRRLKSPIGLMCQREKVLIWSARLLSFTQQLLTFFRELTEKFSKKLAPLTLFIMSRQALFLAFCFYTKCKSTKKSREQPDLDPTEAGDEEEILRVTVTKKRRHRHTNGSRRIEIKSELPCKEIPQSKYKNTKCKQVHKIQKSTSLKLSKWGRHEEHRNRETHGWTIHQEWGGNRSGEWWTSRTWLRSKMRRKEW